MPIHTFLTYTIKSLQTRHILIEDDILSFLAICRTSDVNYLLDQLHNLNESSVVKFDKEDYSYFLLAHKLVSTVMILDNLQYALTPFGYKVLQALQFLKVQDIIDKFVYELLDHYGYILKASEQFNPLSRIFLSEITYHLTDNDIKYLFLLSRSSVLNKKDLVPNTVNVLSYINARIGFPIIMEDSFLKQDCSLESVFRLTNLGSYIISFLIQTDRKVDYYE
jgi:hypothetical protein